MSGKVSTLEGQLSTAQHQNQELSIAQSRAGSRLTTEIQDVSTELSMDTSMDVLQLTDLETSIDQVEGETARDFASVENRLDESEMSLENRLLEAEMDRGMLSSSISSQSNRLMSSLESADDSLKSAILVVSEVCSLHGEMKSMEMEWMCCVAHAHALLTI